MVSLNFISYWLSKLSGEHFQEFIWKIIDFMVKKIDISLGKNEKISFELSCKVEILPLFELLREMA